MINSHDRQFFYFVPKKALLLRNVRASQMKNRHRVTSYSLLYIEYILLLKIQISD